ncbi:MAG: hypothetical protein FWE49_02410 [Synergistaceae bacterium]|nr:hypothetical protein [Synergistaceae bacterium]
MWQKKLAKNKYSEEKQKLLRWRYILKHLLQIKDSEYLQGPISELKIYPYLEDSKRDKVIIIDFEDDTTIHFQQIDSRKNKIWVFENRDGKELRYDWNQLKKYLLKKTRSL